MITRLETMVLLHDEMPLKAIRKQIASAIDILIHVGRMKDHSRKIVNIMEVVASRDEEIVFNPLFQYEDGFKQVGTLIHREKLDHWLEECQYNE